MIYSHCPTLLCNILPTCPILRILSLLLNPFRFHLLLLSFLYPFWQHIHSLCHQCYKLCAVFIELAAATNRIRYVFIRCVIYNALVYFILHLPPGLDALDISA